MEEFERSSAALRSEAIDILDGRWMEAVPAIAGNAWARSLMELFLRSVVVVLGASSVAIGLAALLALATFGRDNRLARCQSGLASCLLLLPSYVVAGAWSAGFGSMGWWTLSQVSAARAPMAGMASVIWIHAMAATPVAFWLLVIGLRRCSTSMIELGRLDGGAKLQFMVGIWPRWSVWILGSFFLVAAWVSGDMVVTNLFQVVTLTEQCYLDRLAGSVDWRSTLAACSLSAGLGLVGLSVFRPFSDRPPEERQPGAWNTAAFGPDWLGLLVGGLVVTLVIGIPLLNLILKAGWLVSQSELGTIQRSWSSWLTIQNTARAPLDYAEEFRWSLSLAGWSATLACVVAVACTRLSLPKNLSPWQASNNFSPNRDPRRLVTGYGFGLLLIAFALPGPIVSGLVISLFQLPIVGFAWLNDHTLAAPILCLQFRLLPVAVFAVTILERQWQDRVGDVWKIDRGKPRWARFVIYSSSIFKPIGLLWVVLYAMAFGDLSSYLQCLPPGVTPVSMRIFDLLHYGVRSSEAGLLLFLAILGTLLGGWFAVGENLTTHDRQKTFAVRGLHHED